MILPLDFSFLGVGRAFLLATEKMGAIRGQTSPRKGCVVSITRFPAFHPVTSQVHQHLLLAQKGQLQPATPVDGGQELHSGTGPL